MPRLLLALVVVTTACATAVPPRVDRYDVYERTYAAERIKTAGCPPGGPGACCADLEEKLRQAMAIGDAAETATTVQSLALSCRSTPELLRAGIQASAAVPSLPGAAGSITAAYDVRLGEEDRLYWAGAFIDGRYPAGTLMAPGVHTLEVELHVMMGVAPGQARIHVVRGRKSVTVDSSDTREVLVTLIHGQADGGMPRPISVTLTERSPSIARAPAGKAVPRLAIGALGPLHLPRELDAARAYGLAVNMCVDERERITTVAPRIPVHPRVLGTILDAYTRTTARPDVVNGKPVPTCFPYKVSIEIVGSRE